MTEWPLEKPWNCMRTSLVIRAMQIQTTMRHHSTPTRLARIKKISIGEDEKWTGTLLHCWWECEMVQLLWKTIPEMVKHEVAIWPRNSTSRNYSWEMKTYIHTFTCTWMFTAALSTIGKRWKQPKCPSTDEWINKIWSIHNGIPLSHREERTTATCHNWDKLWKPYAKCKKPDKKTTYYTIPFIWTVQNKQIDKETESRLVVAWGWGCLED